jgi:hypothetical protein
LVLFIGTASSTTPLCTVTDGMASNTIIPSNEINVSDKTVAVDNLRPESPTPLQSSDGTLIIEYSPSTARPMKEIELVSTENIKSYKVTFYNKDGSVTTKTSGVVEDAVPINNTKMYNFSRIPHLLIIY